MLGLRDENMKAKESSIARITPFPKKTILTLDDVERLASGNRKERRIADKLLRKAESKLRHNAQI
jgi:hypothetical protein